MSGPKDIMLNEIKRYIPYDFPYIENLGGKTCKIQKLEITRGKEVGA